MKKRYAAILAILALALSFVAVPVAGARPLTVCNPTCNGSLHWSGLVSGTHGAQSDFTVDNPGGTNFTFYSKYIELVNASGDWVVAGIDNNNNCASGLHYFYFWWDAQNSTGAIKCSPNTVNSSDINSTVTFGISYFVSHGGGAFVYIYGTPGNDDFCPLNNPCSIGDGHYTAVWTDKYYAVSIGDTSFTNHEVWGGNWVNNKRYVNGIWSYLPFGDNGTFSAGNPVQIFWANGDAPDGSFNNGGDMWSCVYPSGHTCTLGS